jgi:CheY-like chemotaxis protein
MMAESDQGKTATVLVVEDEPEIQRFITRVLAPQGYLVLSANDAAQALEICQHHSGPIHLLLTDVIIPDMNGPQLAVRVQGLRPDIRVLFISAYDDGLLKQNFGLHPNAAFLAKPFGADRLLQKVRAVLDVAG